MKGLRRRPVELSGLADALVLQTKKWGRHSTPGNATIRLAPSDPPRSWPSVTPPGTTISTLRGPGPRNLGAGVVAGQLSEMTVAAICASRLAGSKVFRALVSAHPYNRTQ